MSDEHSITNQDDRPEDLDVIPEDAERVKGGDGTADKKKPRANVSDFNFVHSYDKSSPVL